MPVKNKVNENKLDYEPWGYREQGGYSEKDPVVVSVEKFFANVRYSKRDEKIHFYNIKGEEKGVINVKEFPNDAIKSTSYDAGTKILTIKYESGNIVKLNLTTLINSIINSVLEKTQKDINTLSGAVEEIINNEIDIREKTFSNTEYVWDEGSNKMVLKFYNLNNELKDTVEIFDTNEVGDILMGAGIYE